jgi:hypothetical protein
MSFYQRIAGTSVGSFVLGLLGVKLKNNAGNLEVRNNADTGFADIQAKNVTVSNNTTGYDVTFTTSGAQAADYTLTLPADDGSSGQVLATDGNGVLSWVSAASTAAAVKVDSTTINFGDSSPVPAFNLPANAVVTAVRVIVDTAFNGTPSLSVGIAGNASKYMGSTDNNLTFTAETVFETVPGKPPVVTPEAIEIAYTAGGASAGSCRVEIFHTNPV